MIKPQSFERNVLVKGSAIALISLALGGCGDQAGARGDVPAQGPAHVTTAIESDLALGSEGDEVRSLHLYLASSGYLPSDDVAREFPAWRPIIGESPADPDIFDEVTQRALLAFQARSGVETSGVVDAATREKLRQPRCAVPEGIETSDGSEKYVFAGSGAANGTRKYFLGKGHPDVPIETMRRIVRTVATKWQAVTSIEFVETTVFDNSLPLRIDFDRTWAMADCGVTTGLGAFGSGDMFQVTLNSGCRWSTTTQITPGRVDLETVLLHEFGHVVGLSHTAAAAVMSPGDPRLERKRSLFADDIAGVSTRMDTWRSLPGRLRTVDHGVATIWGLGRDPDQWGQNPVVRWNEGTWAWDPDPLGGSGKKLAVDNLDRPWVIDNNGGIWRRTTSSLAGASWERINGCASEIAAGVNGHVYALGCDATALKSIWKWDGTSGAHPWVLLDRSALKIAVDDLGFLLTIDDLGRIARRFLLADNRGAWVDLPGCATDIDVGVQPYYYAVGCSGGIGGLNIQAYQEDPGVASTWNNYPLFTANRRGGLEISVDTYRYQPWIVTNTGEVLRPVR